jgi:hypothetical protein
MGWREADLSDEDVAVERAGDIAPEDNDCRFEEGRTGSATMHFQ